MNFRVFRLLDFLTFVVPALGALGLTGWAAITPGNPVAGLVITALAAFGFVFVYVLILVRRRMFAGGILYTSSHGILVMRPAPVATPARVLFEKEVERVVKLWEGAVLAEQGNAAVVRRALRGVSLTWKPAPFAVDGLRPGFKWMGLASGSGRVIWVGYKDPIETTALGHEIGHVILLVWKGDGSEETLRAMHDKHGVPY